MATLDTLQDAVNALTSSTTSLLTEVNVNKTTLVNSATNAAASAASASSDKISAAASASQASGSATQAAASAASASAIVLGVASGYPSIAPSLMLDFANTKTLDPRITFSRASTGSYYDGKTVAKAEENLLLRSQEFDQWTSVRCTISANSTSAPDGTTTADTLIWSQSDGTTRTQYSVSILDSKSLTFSVYVKLAQNVPYVWIGDSYTTTAKAVWFKLSDGTIGTQPSGYTGTITNVGNGWYRCTVTFTSSSTTAVYIGISNVDNSISYQASSGGLANDSVYLWGAQLEQRSSVTAYTPTTTAPITNYIPALQTAAAGVARFDHNPTTGESLGLLIEEQRTNLLTYSADFSNAAWTKSGGSISADMVVAPDGTLTGDKLVEDSTNGEHFSRKVSTVTASTAYTATVYAKAGERSYVWLYGYSDPTSASAYFNLAAGTIGTTSGSPNATITPVGNGWYRCSITMTTGSTSFTFEIHSASGNGSESYQGNGTSGIYLWGAQLEAGAFATSYIPTTSAQVTRAADVATMTGTNFSSWYRADEGTIFVEAKSSDVGLGTSIVSATDNTVNNRIQISSFTTVQGLITASGASQASLDGGTPVANVFSKYALSYKLNDCALSLDSAAVATDTSVIVPVLTQLEIGTRQAANNINGTIKKLAYYPKRLTNTELQAVTTA